MAEQGYPSRAPLGCQQYGGPIAKYLFSREGGEKEKEKQTEHKQNSFILSRKCASIYVCVYVYVYVCVCVTICMYVYIYVYLYIYYILIPENLILDVLLHLPPPQNKKTSPTPSPPPFPPQQNNRALAWVYRVLLLTGLSAPGRLEESRPRAH